MCVIANNLYNLEKDHFITKKLIKALNTKEGKVIENQMDSSFVSEILPDHLGKISANISTKEEGKYEARRLYFCFLFCINKGTTPQPYSDAWYNHIVDFIELERLVTNYKRHI